MNRSTTAAAGDREQVHPRHDVSAADCAARPIFKDITSRWAALVITALQERPHRFAQLTARIGGVSEKMLTQTLRALTRNGLISRTATATVPVQVTYDLTDLGRDIAPRIRELVLWVNHHTSTIQAAQVAYDADMPEAPAVANSRR